VPKAESSDHAVWRGKRGGDAKCILPRAHGGQPHTPQHARWLCVCVTEVFAGQNLKNSEVASVQLKLTVQLMHHRSRGGSRHGRALIVERELSFSPEGWLAWLRATQPVDFS